MLDEASREQLRLKLRLANKVVWSVGAMDEIVNMTQVEQVRSYVYPNCGVPIARLRRRVGEIAQHRLAIETWMEERGEAAGAFVKLRSGRIVSLVESQVLIAQGRVHGPMAYFDAGEVADLGVGPLVNDVIDSLTVSQQDIDWVAPNEQQRIAAEHMQHVASRRPPAPFFDPPDSYVRITNPPNSDFEIECYGELDADRYAIRWIRRYQDGRLQACSIGFDDWRDEIPEGAVSRVSESQALRGFAEYEISAAEFEAVWREAVDRK